MKFYAIFAICLLALVALSRVSEAGIPYLGRHPFGRPWWTVYREPKKPKADSSEENVEQRAAGAIKSGAQGAADSVTEFRHDMNEKDAEIRQDAEQTYEHAKEKVKEGTEPARQSLAKHGGEIKEGAQEIKEESGKNMSQVGERFSEGGQKLKEGAGETLGAIKDTAVVGAKTVGEHVSNVASGVAGVASDAASAVAGAAVAAKDAVGKTIIGAGEAITSEQALKERQGETLTTTHEPLKVKRDTHLDHEVVAALETPEHKHYHKAGDLSSSEEQEMRPQRVSRRDLTDLAGDKDQDPAVERPHVDDVMLARPKRYIYA